MIGLNFGPWSMRLRRLATLVCKAAQETQGSLDFVAALALRSSHFARDERLLEGLTP